MSLVGEDRVELSPGVLRTRMLALHDTPKEESKVSSPMSKVCLRYADLGLWTFDFGLSFHADHLLDLSDDLHQILLVLHHRFDRLVSAGNFIQYAYVFTTFNA